MDITTCKRCGEQLYSADSIAVRMGAGCRARYLAEALAGWQDWQVAKAREAVELGAVVPLPRDGIYGVVSSDGSVTYIIDTGLRTCTCKAAQHDRPCYHVPAALIERYGVTTAARTARAA